MNNAIIKKICDDILYEAKYDIIHMAAIRECARDLSCDIRRFREILRCVLLRIQTLDIVIGNIDNPTGKYTEFIGWLGTPEEKVERALTHVKNEHSDGDFTAWLAYSKNVDYYESPPPNPADKVA